MSQPAPSLRASSDLSVIPYVEYYDGERRLLTVDTGQMSIMMGPMNARPTPCIAIDGREYMVFRGLVTFEIPAERDVHVAVWLETDSTKEYKASYLLSPREPAHLLWEKVDHLHNARLIGSR